MSKKVLITKEKIDNVANKVLDITGETSGKTLDELNTTLTNVNNEITTQEELISQLQAAVDSLPEAGGGSSATVKGFGEGTPINLGPEETGTIDTIYVDTSLSEEEIINIICNNLTANNGYYMMALINQSETKGIMGEYTPDSNLLGIMYAIENEEGERKETFLYHNVPEQEQKLGFIGWNPEFDGVIEFNDEFVAFNDFRNLGDLFSITPFGKTIALEGEYDGSPVEFSLSGNGTPFENGTVEEPVYVENIYFNKNLSDEEMYDIIRQQGELYQVPYLMVDVDFTHILGAVPIADDNGDFIGDMFAILMLIEDGSETGQEVVVYHNIPIEEQEALMGSTLDFVGWNPDCDGVLNIGKNMVAAWAVASLGNFISSTPFGGSEIDMTTYINRKKLPLNIKLSGGIKEVSSLPDVSSTNIGDKFVCDGKLYEVKEELNILVYNIIGDGVVNYNEALENEGVPVYITVVSTAPNADAMIESTEDTGVYLYTDKKMLWGKEKGQVFNVIESFDGSVSTFRGIVSSPDEIPLKDEVKGVYLLSEKYFYCANETSELFIEQMLNHTLQSITIPESVSYIQHQQFFYFTDLHTVNMHDNITGISDEAFAFCEKLTSIVLPKNLTYIGEGAFRECSIVNIEIPEGVTKIKEYTFCMRSLESIKFNGPIEEIGNYALTVPALKTIDLSKCTVVPTIYENTIHVFPPDSTVTITEIKVPSALLEEFKTATNWSKYADLMVGV